MRKLLSDIIKGQEVKEDLYLVSRRINVLYCRKGFKIKTQEQVYTLERLYYTDKISKNGGVQYGNKNEKYNRLSWKGYD